MFEQYDSIISKRKGAVDLAKQEASEIFRRQANQDALKIKYMRAELAVAAARDLFRYALDHGNVELAMRMQEKLERLGTASTQEKQQTPKLTLDSFGLRM